MRTLGIFKRGELYVSNWNLGKLIWQKYKENWAGNKNNHWKISPTFKPEVKKAEFQLERYHRRQRHPQSAPVRYGIWLSAVTQRNGRAIIISEIWYWVILKRLTVLPEISTYTCLYMTKWLVWGKNTVCST